ncbi:restriction endonuclease subunit S [Bacteroides clarus]|uniref:restriction endonuclease subunit S n=1 Tax=Bacteroides clarus TaxID=626929 RepID=UPI0024324C50|nr:restriction endonuclease subunit S [Bacteroides clarus]
MATDNKNKVLNVPHLRFPEFSGEWEKCKVSDLLDFYSTNSLSWEQLEYDTNTMMNLHYGLIHVGLPTMVDLSKDKLPNIKEDNIPKNFELCKEGDVAFADASEDTNEVAKTIEFYNLAEKNVVCGLHTIHGRDNKHKTIVGFKGYAFSSTAFHNQIRRIAQGTKIYSISTKNFSECHIGLPSKPEQTKIATLLRLIDERIATQNKIIEDLKKLKSVIIDYAFTNNKDVEREQILLSDISTKITRKNTDNRISNVLSNSANQGVVPQSGVFDREIANEENISNYIVISYNDFVYNPRKSAIAPYGPINKYNGELKGVISPLYLCFRTHDINAEYLAWYFKSRLWHEYIYKNGDAGIRHDRVSIKDDVFFSMPLKIHSKLEQGRIANKLNKIESFVMHEIQYLSLVQTQKYFLLQQMFI